ncbi:MAG: hypothetical protein JSR82_19455 [Verrucomicrobia bacterium]|nr:hypothetical protein [Verrucomicrobiota bacterium]
MRYSPDVFSLSPRERWLVVFAAVALVSGAGIKHWREKQHLRSFSQASVPVQAADATK